MIFLGKKILSVAKKTFCTLLYDPAIFPKAIAWGFIDALMASKTHWVLLISDSLKENFSSCLIFCSTAVDIRKHTLIKYSNESGSKMNFKDHALKMLQCL